MWSFYHHDMSSYLSMQVPFEESHQFDDKELQENWDGAMALWHGLSNVNKTFLLVRWKNECDALGPFYSYGRHGVTKLHRLFAEDIRNLTDKVLDETFKGPIVNSDNDEYDDDDDYNIQ